MPRRNGRNPKSPAFQWYPTDAISDERYASLTYEERGIFHALLDFAWLNDGIPEDPESIARLLRVPPVDLERAWLRLGRLFVPLEGRAAGRLYSPRLERERAAQGENRAARARAGKAGNRARWEQPCDPCAIADASQTDRTAIAKVSPPSPVSRLPSPDPRGREREPSPEVEEGAPGGEPAGAPVGSRLLAGLAMHPKLDTQAVRAALERWEAHRGERGAGHYTSASAESALLAWERHGPEWLVRAVGVWIERNAKQWFELDDGATGGLGPIPGITAPLPEHPGAVLLRRHRESQARKKAQQ